jgi:hypothetical protein
MSEPPALSHYTGGGDFKPRVPTQRRADPPSAVSPVTAVPVLVKAAEPPALVAHVVARQQDPNLGLPTYKSQINGRSILRVEGSRSEAPLLSDSAVKSIEEARKQQQEDQTRSSKPSPPAPLATKTIKSTNSHKEPAPARAKAKEPSSNNVTATNRHAAAPPTASPKPMKQASAKKVSSSPPTASPKPVKQGSVKKAIPPPSPVNPAHEPAPVSPVSPKAPPVHRPLNETWEFVGPQQERGSCCVII